MLKIKGAYGPEYQVHDPGNGVIGGALREGIPYEHKLLYHIFRRGYTGTAVDVGAHIGNHTLWFALACGLKVYAFEPIEHRKLVENLDLNGLGDDAVKVQRVALGDHDCRAYPVGKGELVEGVDGAIRVRLLDDFKITDVAFIKIDVEGWEPQVLRGAEATILRYRPVIYAEAQTQEARERNTQVLERYGYHHITTFGATPMEEWEPNEAS